MTKPAAVPATAHHPLAYHERWFAKVFMLALSVLGFTLALAPAGQFYLAWAAAVPWLYVVRRAKSPGRAFLWSWLAGTLFFLANLWWLAYVTRPGMAGLVVYLGLYWGFAALILRGAGFLTRHHRVVVNVLGTAAVLTALEWVRGNLFTGLPWLYLGHTQSPILVMCQIADALGVFGISFWVASLNALAFAWVMNPNRRGVIAATATVGGLTVAIFAYGLFRDRQTPHMLTPGPVVAVIQSNYPQDNSGEKGAPDTERVKFHIDQTEEAVRKSNGSIDLACWSETMIPGLNAEYRTGMSGARLVDPSGKLVDADYAATLNGVFDRLVALSSEYRVNLLTGSFYAADLRDPEHFLFADRRNTAYLFRPSGGMAEEHYDKIHLVPFGEFIPFKRSGPLLHWLYTFFMSFSPYNFDYTLTAGPEDNPTVFTITTHDGQPVRFITPICFEDLDPALCAKMFRGKDGAKRADLLVNLTNDGWFKANENPQHLQAAIFRSIENRVPTARSVNTGISGFIDSYGRVSDKISAQTPGTAVRRVMLDRRYTLFTRIGDLFGILCTATTALITAIGLRDWRRTRRARTT